MNIILFDSLSEENIIPLDDERSMHILNVLHLAVGDTFKCGEIEGSKGKAKITMISAEGISFEYKMEVLEKKNSMPLTVIVGACRPICLKRMLRAAGECGVEHIIICGTELGEKSYLSSNFLQSDEWKDVAFDAAMQSGETSFVKLSITKDVNEGIELAKKDERIKFVILDNKTEFYSKGINGSFLSLNIRIPKLEGNLKNVPTVIAVGPERGWTDNERDIFVKSEYEPRILSNRILRSETAFITALLPFL